MATKKQPNFEEALAQLEAIVQKLEQADVPLDEALSYFQKGMELSRFCQKKLTVAEQTVTKLMQEEAQSTEDAQ